MKSIGAPGELLIDHLQTLSWSRRQSVSSRRLLERPCPADLHEGKQLRHDVEEVLHLGPNPGFQSLQRTRQAAAEAVFPLGSSCHKPSLLQVEA